MGTGTPPDVEQLQAELRAHQDLLGELWLYVHWRWITKNLTTVDKERWATAVEEWEKRLHADDPKSLANLRPADRWWLCPTCGIDNHSGPNDGPHEACRYAARGGPCPS